MGIWSALQHLDDRVLLARPGRKRILLGYAITLALLFLLLLTMFGHEGKGDWHWEFSYPRLGIWIVIGVYFLVRRLTRKRR